VTARGGLVSCSLSVIPAPRHRTPELSPSSAPFGWGREYSVGREGARSMERVGVLPQIVLNR
jgi:hypothetical protein